MVNQLLDNDKISFVVARRFSSRGKDYEVGDDFPQEDTNKIETFVRARYIIPVVETIEDKQHIRHWHRHIRPKDEVLERLSRDRTQLVMPDEATPEPAGVEATESPDEPDGDGAPSDGAPDFDPSEHTVVEVLDYLAEHPEDRDRVLAAEEADRGRKGILES